MIGAPICVDSSLGQPVRMLCLDVVSVSSDKCTYFKSLRIKASAKPMQSIVYSKWIVFLCWDLWHVSCNVSCNLSMCLTISTISDTVHNDCVMYALLS